MEAIESPNPSAAIADFVANLTYDDLPDAAVRSAERCIVDTVGVTLAGASTEAAERARRAVATESCDAHVWGTDVTASLADATFLNGIAGHALDFDDVSLRTMDGHPSVTMVAPIVETARAVDASPKDALTAFVVGFETQSYVTAPIRPSHYERGWHATGTIGTFGATAAVAAVLGLSASETRHALNIAASMPAGVKRNFGSMTKPMHVGQAARSGVTAASLADEGFTADDAAVGGDKGFQDLYSGDGGKADDIDFELGKTLILCDQGVDVKKYPCCYYAHTAIAATIDLACKHDVTPNDVDEIRVESSQGAADALHHDDPETTLEAKFSMPYLVARALAKRRVGLAAFESEALDDQTVRRLAERTTLSVNDSLSYDSNAATVDIRTSDGEYVKERERPPGTHYDPLSEEELAEKFRMCAERAMSSTDATALLETLTAFRDKQSVSTALESL